MENYITKIEVDLSSWSDHYPTGCILYHYDQVIDSAYCDNAEEFIEYINSYKHLLNRNITYVRFIFDGYDLDEYESTAIECAKEVYKAFNKLIKGDN